MYALSVEKPKSLAHQVSIVLLASICMGLFGRIAIPLWFSPIPIATQNSVILCLAAMLGARRATMATFLFLMQGAMGFPVFSIPGGFHVLLGPTGGYLLGYLAAAFVVGAIAERNKSMANTALALTVGNLLIYFCGAGYLTTFLGWEKAILVGVLPFILGDIIKTAVSLKAIQWKNSLHTI